MTFIEELQARGLVQDIMPGTEELLLKGMTSAYIGFDPTAESLHVGSLLPITLLMRLQRGGHKPFALIGGATGMIGDPSGKSAERNLLDMQTIEKNCHAIRAQLSKFIDFSDEKPNAAVLVNNYDWFKNFSFLDFIRDAGKLLTVNYMMAKDSVKKRLETGLSFTEFSYQLIQGYDFLHLYQTYNVQLQMGGADQWGNITTGTELIRKKCSGEAFAFTSPLITKADGSKFGKSEGGNIWLDANLTSPYKFYQFWFNLSDEEAEKMAMIFSFKPVNEIQGLIAQHRTAPHLYTLQKALAAELTTMVHSEEELQFAIKASEILFSKTAVDELKLLSERQLLELMEGVTQVLAPLSLISNDGVDLISFLADTGIYSSKGEARKALQGNAISLNKEKVSSQEFKIQKEHLLNNKYVLIQKGKKDYTLAIFE
jgi:tyrosyl-tRNA synthetase